MWLCTGISLVRKVLQTWSKAQKARQVLLFALDKKNFGWGMCFFCFVRGMRFFVSDVISRGLLGHLGPLHLSLGPNS